MPATALPTPSVACTRPAAPGRPASVASTVAPVWVAPKSMPMQTWAASSTTKAALSRVPRRTPRRGRGDR